VKKTNSVEVVNDLVSEWLQGRILAAFEFAAGFRLRIETIGSAELMPTSKFPEIAILDLKSDWGFGSPDLWGSTVERISVTVGTELLEEPTQAFCLMRLIGHMIVEVNVALDAFLSLVFDTGDILFVKPFTNVWDESWLIYPPPDLPGDQMVSILCDAHGVVSAYWREASNLS
jgi:hypothetical protein